MRLRAVVPCQQNFIVRKKVYAIILRRNNDFTGFKIDNTVVTWGKVCGKIQFINIFRSNLLPSRHMVVISIETNIILVRIRLPLLL